MLCHLDPVPDCAQSCAKCPEGRMCPFTGHQEGACLSPAARFLKLSRYFFDIPTPFLLCRQQVVHQMRVEDSGDASHCQLLIQEQGQQFRVTVRIVNLQK
uniref:Uncharacterized protein n=1 Tax=Sphaerodactylus townsendi TaxID=933632 RepID=A0ACB8GDB6_9SAUR